MPDSWTDGLAYEVMGTPLWTYVALVATFVGTYTGYRILMRILESRWLLALAENQPELYKSIIGTCATRCVFFSSPSQRASGCTISHCPRRSPVSLRACF